MENLFPITFSLTTSIYVSSENFMRIRFKLKEIFIFKVLINLSDSTCSSNFCSSHFLVNYIDMIVLEGSSHFQVVLNLCEQ